MELSPEIVAAGLAAFLRSAGLNVARSAGAAHAGAPGRAAAAHSRRSAPAARTAPRRKLPEGSFATAGIGCHFMALDDGDQTRTFTQMGGEGAPFVGMAPFTDTPHVFANMGDGTYHALRHHGDPPGGRGGHAHDLQAAGQRRGGDDRRPAGRGRLHRSPQYRRADRRRRRRAHRHGRRRGGPAAAGIGAAARHDAAYARRPRRGAARAARLRRRRRC